MVKTKIINERKFLEESILKVISENSKGLPLEVLLEYLDYINKFSYDSKYILGILERLINKQKILKKNNLFIINK